ncbi:Hypothetical protein azo3195 [Azoarcus olearius]|uniref:PilZ domain-containing protein n=1 Tax=Azoarcus sp. (strain BH72) TaxID=418699 RepID=A1KAF6_AZOSB|nr:Hypothetical protein azo3195 [Azoarcus olearius]
MAHSGAAFDFTGGDASMVAVGTALRDAIAVINEQASGGAEVRLDVLDRLHGALRSALAGDVGLSWPSEADEAVLLCAEVRQAFLHLFDSYASVGAEGAEERSACAVEFVLWSRLARRAVPDAVWYLLGANFERAAAIRSVVAGDEAGPARLLLRACAFYTAGLDQLHPRDGYDVSRLIDVCLPFLALDREASASQYSLDPERGFSPTRFAAGASARVWYFATEAAARYLAGLSGRLERGERRLLPIQPLADLQDGLRHLLAHWSPAPPLRRFRRHVVSGSLSVVRGLAEIGGLLKSGGDSATPVEWALRDLSRGGVGAFAQGQDVAATPLRGELVSFRPNDGLQWHVGIVRRVLQMDKGAEVGIETLSTRPATVEVDDGSQPHQAILFDPVIKGEAVRLAVPKSALRAGVPVFVTVDKKLQKLKPIDLRAEEGGVELRVYQVL